MTKTLEPGLYIVATPIGNLSDLSSRAADILRQADVIAVEDSRVTGKLLNHLGIKRPMTPYHDHVAEGVRPALVARMAGEAVALVSDAGTPLISDPGYRLVRAARERGIAVTSIPGPSAAVVALTLAGLPSDRFLFAGFLPAKDKARREVLAELGGVRATLVFYETAPRLAQSLAAIGELLPGREVAVARELTKRFEECRTGSPDELIAHFAAHPPKGEIVLLVAPPVAVEASASYADALLRAALVTLKPSQAAAEVARATGLERKVLYARALELR